MEPSLFIEYVERYFPKLVISVTNFLNDQSKLPVYYHQRFLRPEFSITGKWDAISRYNTAVMADVIALDSSIPLKRRPTVNSVTGEIPKIATERQLNESQLSQLQLLTGRAQENDLQIRQLLFEDVPAVIRGQYERMEAMFLQAFSSGVMLVDVDTNVGTGIRVDFQYPAANQFTATVVWGDPGYTPLSDLQVAVDKASADGFPIRLFLIDRPTFNLIAASDEAKNLFANSQGIQTGTFAPTLDQLNTAVETNWGYRFELIERSVVAEINGVQTSFIPWEAGQVIGINNEQVGALVWSNVAEMSFPVGGVTYQRAGRQNYILVKKYRSVRPSLAEFTASESRSLPVIGNVNQIYKLDSTEGATT